jgi:hypothetical protein
VKEVEEVGAIVDIVWSCDEEPTVPLGFHKLKLLGYIRKWPEENGQERAMAGLTAVSHTV